jgi:site-specific recombinase XerD/transposase
MARKKRRPSDKQPEPSPIANHGMMPYLKLFLDSSAASGLSPRTIELRERILKIFIGWCDERNLDKPQDITRPILERYRRYLYHYRKKDGDPISFATQQQRLVPIKAFFKWLARENYILYNPASELELPKVHKRLPKHILTAQEVEQILNQTALHGDLGIRDRAIIETLYSTGIRRAELINLKLYDVDTQNGTLMVREGKGKKDRMLPLGEQATKITAGWNKTGVDKPIETTGSRTRLNFIGAIRLGYLSDTVVDQYKTVNGESIIEFLNKTREFYSCSSTIHLVLDGAGYHRSLQVVEEAKKLNIKLHYLPPYSPNLNSIERLWKVMNKHARNSQYFTTEKEFRERSDRFFSIILPNISDSLDSTINDNFQKLQSAI